MRFLFNVWSRSGHLNPSIGLARELLGRGHDVAFVCAGDEIKVDDRLRQVGLDLRCVRPAGAKVASVSVDRGIELTRHLADASWRQKYLERLFLHHELASVEYLRGAIREFGPSVFCTEAAACGGAIAAELEGVRWATIASCWDLAVRPAEESPFLAAIRAMSTKRDAAVKAAGASLAFYGPQAVSPFLNLMSGLTAITPLHGDMPARSYIVGPCRVNRREEEIPFPWEKLDPDLPLVYVSSGTELFFEPAVTSALVAGAKAGGSQVVIASRDPVCWIEDKEVINVRHAPQLALLRRARLCVTSGGVNSVLECIAAAVPMLVIPLGYDQPINAQRLKSAGVAAVADDKNRTPAYFSSVIPLLLSHDAPERVQINRLQAVFDEEDGCATGAGLLEELAGSQNRQSARIS